MLEVFVLMAVAVLLAGLYSRYSCKPTLTEIDSGKNKLSDQSTTANLFYFILLICLVCFAGLRTVMNDTGLYIVNFSNIPSALGEIKNIDWAIGANPLFKVWQILIKALISADSHVFIFLSALFTVSLSLAFLRKYSQNFTFSVFVFLGLCVYAFMLAAIKQTMATAIAVWAIPKAWEKKWISAIVLVLIAVFIHPYVFIIAVAFFLGDNVWDKRTVCILLSTVCGVFFIETVADIASAVTEVLGDNYSSEGIIGDHGVNIFRLLVYAVVPVLSLIFKNNLRDCQSKIINVSVNCSIIAFCLMLIAFFANPIVFGRLAGYFDIFICIALPYVLWYGISDSKSRKAIIFIAIPCFCLFYWKYYSKYGTSLFADYYHHISLFELFGG